MATTSGTSEIVESMDELGSEAKVNINEERQIGKLARQYSIEDDINKLFEAIDMRNSRRGTGQSEEVARDALRKSAMKRPMRVGYSQASGIGISESVSLKQALRGLCISQASEMAAVKKRLSKPSALPDVGALKRLYQAVVVEANESSGQPINLGSGNLVEISLVPERKMSDVSVKAFESDHDYPVEQSNHGAGTSTLSLDELPQNVAEDLPMDEILPSSTSVGSPFSEAGLQQGKKLKLPHSSNRTPNLKLPALDELATASDKGPMASTGPEKQEQGKLDSPSYSSVSNAGNKFTKPVSSTPRLIRPIFRSKSFNSKKFMQSTSHSSGSQQSTGMNISSVCTSSDTGSQTPNSARAKGSKAEDEVSPVSSSGNASMEVNSKPVECLVSKPGSNSFSYGKTMSIVTKADKASRSREKGEISQSSKSSIGDYSSTTSFSEESHLSGANRSGYRPHMSKDVRWEAINCVKKNYGSLGLRNFKLLRKLGGGDIGSVYLAELVGTNCLFAVKVMDNDFLANRRKMARALTEKEILEMLDHPFLPTLYANFMTDKYSCLVIEYCPGGDLHVLRQKQPTRSFTEQAARFYVAEVLLALEYLHMLGVIYRDLKPENVLVREDGHIMLTDFDLSLRCAVSPTLLKSSSPLVAPPKKMSSPCSESSCIDPFCLNPSWQVSCFTPRFLSAAAKSRKLKSEIAAQVSPLPQLVVEPTSARSNSFVGTHEYLAPEIIKAEGHGSAVDWWTLGIFLYELLYGKTPFKGAGNEETLANVVSQCLKFPETPMVSSHARDLMRRLLQKEPENRLGSERGAAEIKQHPFFEGLNLALIRCTTPPELPKLPDLGYTSFESFSQSKQNGISQKESKSTGEDIEFEMF